MTKEDTIPHLGQLSVNAIVYKHLPDGQFHPEAVWYDSFQVNFLEDSPDKCIEVVKKMIEEFKKKNAEQTYSN